MITHRNRYTCPSRSHYQPCCTQDGALNLEKKVEQVSNEVNEKIQDIGKESVPTKRICEFILKALKDTDKMGYVRFYGGFKKVTDPKEYKKIVDTLH